MEDKGYQSEILTVMFTDIVGYTSTTTRLKREEFNELQNNFDQLSLSTFEKHSGKVIKKIGDSYLITFKSATDSVLCGIELQEKFKNYNLKNKPKNPLRIRVSLHMGEAILKNNDIYGDTVNLAARLENLTPSGEIYFSETVAQSINKNEIPILEVGYAQVKGFSEPIRIFKVRWKKDQKRMFLNWIFETILIVLFIILIIVALGIFYKKYF